MCNVTQDPSSWYCTQAVESLRRFANDPTSNSGYHTYENLLAYQAVIDAGVKAPLNASELAAFQSIMYKGVLGLSNYATRVENHCVDIAVQQLYMMKVTIPSSSAARLTPRLTARAPRRSSRR